VLNASLEELRAQGKRWIAGEAEKHEKPAYEWLADLRYVGQNGELILPLPQENLNAADIEKLIDGFGERHEAMYGYRLPGHGVEIVTLRLVVRATRATPPAEQAQLAGMKLEDAVLEMRDVWFSETGFVKTPVYDRTRLPVDCTFRGPAIVEQMDTTTVVPPDTTVMHDRFGYLHIEMEPAATGKTR
jgi:N-methylhydantoinase A